MASKHGYYNYILGAMHEDCKLCIFMGKTNPNAPKHKQQSMIIVPMDAPGITIVRPLTVFGYMDPPGIYRVKSEMFALFLLQNI